MGFLDLAIHLLNFLAPALAVAVVVAIAARWIVPHRAPDLGMGAQVAINFVAGSVTLGLGLWLLGRDGKMASYAALLVVVATSQWLTGRAWR